MNFKSSSSTRREKEIPYPFLSNFLGTSDYYKPSKKLKFDHRVTSHDVGQEQVQQMKQKEDTIQNIKTLEKEEDRRYIQAVMNSISKESKDRNTIFLKFANDFKNANDKIQLENIALKQAK